MKKPEVVSSVKVLGQRVRDRDRTPKLDVIREVSFTVCWGVDSLKSLQLVSFFCSIRYLYVTDLRRNIIRDDVRIDNVSCED